MNKKAATRIPSTRGVYAFLIQPRIADRLPASYVMYVGQSASLKERFTQYISERDSELGRPKIVRLLQLYDSFVYFCWTAVPKTIPLDAIEDELIEAFLPPVNDKFPASVRRIMNAF